jgi:tetrahydrodipicolinate N-succinyltransferase
LGANATVVCGVTIGQYAIIVAGAVVKSDVPDYAILQAFRLNRLVGHAGVEPYYTLLAIVQYVSIVEMNI